MLSIEDISKLEKKGEGSYGVVFKYDNNTVVKVVPVESLFREDTFSPFYSLNVESQLLGLFDFKHIIKIEQSYIIDGILPGSNDDDQINAKMSKLFIMKYAKHGNLFEYLKKSLKSDLGGLFKTILFQVAFALQTIYDVYPNFRHNDLGLRNILIFETTKNTKPTLDYVWGNGNKVFTIPNIGYDIKLCDFGLACIGGIVDNYELIKLRMTCISFSIGYKQNQKADLFRFISSFFNIMRPHIDEKLGNTLISLFNGHIGSDKYKNNFYYAPNHIMEDLPTVSELLLCQDIFDSKNISTCCVKTKPLFKHKQNGETRDVPILLPTKKYIISNEYFKSMPSSLQHVIRFKKQKQNKNVSKKDVFNILLLGFPKKKFPKEFIKTVCLKSNEFLNSICIMSVEHKTLIIILVAVDMYKNTNYAEYGKYYNDIWCNRVYLFLYEICEK